MEVSRLMLTYLGQTTGKHTPMDLSEICRQSLPLLQAAIPKETVFLTDLPSPGPTIIANANQIQQALTNLITNAWEAGDNNLGDIKLTVKMVSPTDISAIHYFPIDFRSQDLAYACLEITDVGCGIAGDDIEKIFDPFFSSKFPGRGLGLPTVLGIVKSHNGVVTVQSKIRQGSTFRVYLPVCGKEISLQPLDTTVQALRSEGGGTVLLVEDEEIVRNMAETMLTCLGNKVFLAKDGVEAAEVFKRYKDEIGVVLCDLSMPRMNGWETLSALRRIRPDIPVVIVSGYDESKVRTDNRSELAHIFLHKPYQMAELKDALTRAMKSD